LSDSVTTHFQENTRIERFTKSPIIAQQLCNVCNSPAIAVRRQALDINTPSTWENESTMKLLGLKTVTGELRLCLHCFHVFRSPLFEEARIYGTQGGQCRKETFEKYFPGQTYGATKAVSAEDWGRQTGNVFSYLSSVLHQASSLFANDKRKTGTLRLLDWGGSDGYLCEAIALVSEKVLRVKCETFCFDYQTDSVSNSPYFHYLGAEKIAEHAPYDALVLSHVLEHTAFPAETIKLCGQYLSEDGILLIAVPYEQPYVLLKPNAYMNYHQSAFSRASMRRLLANCGFGTSHVRLANLSYRGSPMWNILAAAGRSKTPSTRIQRAAEVFAFLKVSASEAFRLLRAQ
jgi:hypothetical protein